MYTFLPKCHSTSISFPDSDKRSMFLSKCQLSAPTLIIKARSKIQQRNCNFASKEFIIAFYFKVPGSLFFFLKGLYCFLLIKKKKKSVYGTCQVVQWLRLHVPNIGSPCSIPGQVTCHDLMQPNK